MQQNKFKKQERESPVWLDRLAACSSMSAGQRDAAAMLLNRKQKECLASPDTLADEDIPAFIGAALSAAIRGFQRAGEGAAAQDDHATEQGAVSTPQAEQKKRSTPSPPAVGSEAATELAVPEHTWCDGDRLGPNRPTFESLHRVQPILLVVKIYRYPEHLALLDSIVFEAGHTLWHVARAVCSRVGWPEDSQVSLCLEECATKGQVPALEPMTKTLLSAGLHTGDIICVQRNEDSVVTSAFLLGLLNGAKHDSQRPVPRSQRVLPALVSALVAQSQQRPESRPLPQIEPLPAEGSSSPSPSPSPAAVEHKVEESEIARELRKAFPAFGRLNPTDAQWHSILERLRRLSAGDDPGQDPPLGLSPEKWGFMLSRILAGDPEYILPEVLSRSYDFGTPADSVTAC